MSNTLARVPCIAVAPKWETDANVSFFKPFMSTAAMCGVMQVIGLAIAYSVYTMGATASYATKMQAATADDKHWMFAALVVVAFSIRLVNFYPMVYKEKVMKGVRRTVSLDPRAVGLSAHCRVALHPQGRVLTQGPWIVTIRSLLRAGAA